MWTPSRKAIEGLHDALTIMSARHCRFFKRAADLIRGAPADYIHVNRAIAYLELGEYEALIENVEKALAVNPRLDLVLPLAALAYSLRGNDAAAADWAAKAVVANTIPSDVSTGDVDVLEHVRCLVGSAAAVASILCRA